jgi:hypothetical protein
MYTGDPGGGLHVYRRPGVTCIPEIPGDLCIPGGYMYTGDPRRPMYTGDPGRGYMYTGDRGLHVYRRSQETYVYRGVTCIPEIPGGLHVYRCCVRVMRSVFCVLRFVFCDFCVLRSGDLENVPALRRLDYDGIACYADYYVDMSHNFV